MKKKLVPGVIGLLLLAALGYWWSQRTPAGAPPVLYGTVDFRQAQLAFNNGERLREVLVQEGDRVQAGQVLARVETDRLAPQAAAAGAQAQALRETLARLQHGARPEELAQAAADRDALAQLVQRLKNGARPQELQAAQAQAQAAAEIVRKLKNGSRPEELAQAQARLTAAQAAETQAQQTLTRLESLHTATAGAVSEQDLEAAQSAAAAATAARVVAANGLALAKAGPRAEEVAEAEAHQLAAAATLALVQAGPRAEDIAEAEARLHAAAQRFALVQAGPRAEDIAEAAARLHAAEAQAALAQRQLDDAELRAPANGVVRSRILEPGELAAPGRPAVIVAQTDLKWVRAYLAETQLGAVKPGAVAAIHVDSFPDAPFSGWVGFISPVAEFTPRTVQTEELRTSLMYEVRVFVEDPTDQLRLGMPATVTFTGAQRNPDSPAPAAPAAPPVPAPAAPRAVQP